MPKPKRVTVGTVEPLLPIVEIGGPLPPIEGKRVRCPLCNRSVRLLPAAYRTQCPDHGHVCIVCPNCSTHHQLAALVGAERSGESG